MAERGLGMRSEVLLRRVALGCAVVMLFGPLGGRTMWVRGNGRNVTTDAAIYNMVAVFTGVVALAALAVALTARPRVVVPVLAALAAVAAFGLSVYVSGLYVWARWQGEVWSYGGGWFAGDWGPKWKVHLAWGPPFFALAALVGASASLGLAAPWLWRLRGDPAGAAGSGDAGLPPESAAAEGAIAPERWQGR